jgi:hypothetical protein
MKHSFTLVGIKLDKTLLYTFLLGIRLDARANQNVVAGAKTLVIAGNRNLFVLQAVTCELNCLRGRVLILKY